MVSVLASSVVDRVFEPRSCLTNNYKIGVCCFSSYHASLKRKNKDWLARNQDNVFEWGDMSIRGLLFSELALRIQLGVLVYYKANLIMISLNINLFSPWYSWNFSELALNNNHSLTYVITFRSACIIVVVFFICIWIQQSFTWMAD